MGKLRIAQYFGDKRNTGQYDNGVWQDILGIPFIARIDQAGDYDVVIRTLWLEAIGWSKEIRNRFPHVKQIGLSDHPLSSHISKVSPTQQLAYLSDLEYVDGIMALTEEERQWYQVALPSKPVIKSGLPFPFESYEKAFGHLRVKERPYIGLGVGASDNDRNFITNFIIFQRLKLEYPDLQGVFLSIPTNQLSKVLPYCDASKDIFIQERENMPEFYDILSQCKFVLGMADRNTPGRIQGESAFFGVPVIGSNRLELQNELFPDLSVSPYSAEQALNLARFLIDNPEWEEPILRRAFNNLQKYNYSATRRKFNKLLKDIESKG